ncbi:MAG: response regulator [Candidatus Omnitrophica bacterium]|nr:response regulator [Candidatus Omnitrophota bacterium]
MMRILLVDDNPTDCLILERILQKHSDMFSYQLTKAHSAEDAVRMLDTERFDIALLDYNLPGKNGLAILGHIQSKGIETPVIMVTGQGDEQIAVKAMKEGAYDYIVKQEGYAMTVPFIIQRVLEEFQRKKEKERLERELAIKNTELEAANKELKKLDELKSEFVSNVSHEFRTPLTSITQAVELLLEKRMGAINADQEEFLKIIDQDIKRLTRLINDLLDMSKLEAGKIVLEKKKESLGAVVIAVLSSLKTLADARSIELCNELRGSLPAIYGDAERLIQVLTNLVGNAIKYIDEGGTVRLGAEQVIRGSDECLQVWVKDDGPGIARDHLPKLFNKFEQFKRVAGPGAQGTGLGLSIAKEIVELHGGDIWAESELGRGTTFYFTVPLFTGFLYLKDQLNDAIHSHPERPVFCILIRCDDLNIIQQKLDDETRKRARRELEDMLSEIIRMPSDILVELDNFCFGIVVSAPKDAVEAIRKRLVAALYLYTLKTGTEGIKLSFSVGGAGYPDDGTNALELTEIAQGRYSR